MTNWKNRVSTDGDGKDHGEHVAIKFGQVNFGMLTGPPSGDSKNSHENAECRSGVQEEACTKNTKLEFPVFRAMKIGGMTNVAKGTV